MDIISTILNNWDVITLIVTNIGALFIQSPIKKKD